MRIWVLFCLCALAAVAHDTPHVLPRMVFTARNFLASLTPEQREQTVFAFEDEERFFWHYIPSADIPGRYGRPRKGLTLKEMSPHQKALAASLLSAGLSQQGYIKATTIMSLEDILRIMENDTKGRRDPERYHFSIFGEPSEAGPWAYRIEGHHVSLHFTVTKGRVVGNPTFFGSNPAEVREGPRKGLRILGAEEDKARALLDALTPEQRKTCIVAAEAYPDILTERTRKAALAGQPSGLPASKLTPAQRKLLDVLLDEYVDNLPGELAAQRQTRIHESGIRSGSPGQALSSEAARIITGFSRRRFSSNTITPRTAPITSIPYGAISKTTLEWTCWRSTIARLRRGMATRLRAALRNRRPARC